MEFVPSHVSGAGGDREPSLQEQRHDRIVTMPARDRVDSEARGADSDRLQGEEGVGVRPDEQEGSGEYE